MHDETADPFCDHLRALVEMPSLSGYEDVIREHLVPALGCSGILLMKDDYGNLWATRPGGRPGHVLLCAHMDKRLHANCVGCPGPGGALRVDADPFRPYGVRDLRASGFEEEGFSPVRLDRMGPDRWRVMTDRGPASEDTWVFLLAPLREKDGLLTGKFDDALGVTLVLDALLGTDADACPTLSALFTVGEEAGLLGAQYVVENGGFDRVMPDSVIVLDTSAAMRPGDGIVLYRHCARRPDEPDDSPSNRLVRHIEAFAATVNAPVTTHEARQNDAFVFAGRTPYPTVALEVPIENMHEAVETVARSDVEQMRGFLKTYLRDAASRA